MNLSNIWHGIVAWLISGMAFLLYLAFNLASMCLLAGALFFLSREFFTAELRIKDKLELDEITPECTLQALKIWEWDRDTLMDFVVPLLCSLLLIVCYNRWHTCH